MVFANFYHYSGLYKLGHVIKLELENLVKLRLLCSLMLGVINKQLYYAIVQ